MSMSQGPGIRDSQGDMRVDIFLAIDREAKRLLPFDPGPSSVSA